MLKIYNQFLNYMNYLIKIDWIKNLYFGNLEIIKLVGYDINFNDYVDENKIKLNHHIYQTLDGSKKKYHYFY